MSEQRGEQFARRLRSLLDKANEESKLLKEEVKRKDDELQQKDKQLQEKSKEIESLKAELERVKRQQQNNMPFKNEPDFSERQMLGPSPSPLDGSLEWSTSLISPGHSTFVATPTEFSLKSLMNLLGKVAYLWNQIGIQLKINSGRLKSIKNECNNDMDCLAATLDAWLADEALPCNYETIYDILRSPSVNRSDLIPSDFR